MKMMINLFALMGITTLSNGLYNAALFKPAVQSSLYPPYFAYLGVDGNNDDSITHGHCQHTWIEANPWWMVDLRGQFVVDTLKITNRNYAAFRLRNFRIDIYQQDPRNLVNFPNITGDVCYNQTAPLSNGTSTFTCPVPIVGRFVLLSMKPDTDDCLHICEMEILVSEAKSEEYFFTVHSDTKLSGSVLNTLTVSDSSSCVQQCLARKSSRCTAFNWVTISKTCQLFSVNPSLNLTSYLKSAVGTNFYIQNTAI